MSRTLTLLAAGAGVLLAACQWQGPVRSSTSASASTSTVPATTAAPLPPMSPGVLPYKVLHASAQCGADTPLVERIADAGGLRQAVAGRMVGAAVAVPEADFDHSWVLRVSMGQQPNAGHRMGVIGVRLGSDPGQLVIDTVWAPPEPGRMYAAVVAQPCVIVAVPRVKLGSAVVLDAQGRQRAIAVLP